MIYPIIDTLAKEGTVPKADLLYLLDHIKDEERNYLYQKAHEVRYRHYENTVFVRGLIEFSNYCKNACNYCGISVHNKELKRCRMTSDEIVQTAERGDQIGVRTFVLQGGEDPVFTDEVFVRLIEDIKLKFKDVAITLSAGERSKESYQKFFDAGADRFLIRHEAINKDLYEKLHPQMSHKERIQALYDLKAIGYQVGTGFMVGVPGQTHENLVDDLLFIKDLNPHMVGIGPFIPHKDTPFKGEVSGSAELTYTLLAILRLMLPKSLLPATTSLATLNTKNRYKAFSAGANVVMPNLTPYDYKKNYNLYDGKKITNTESYEALEELKAQCQEAGFRIDMSRGDYKDWSRKND